MEKGATDPLSNIPYFARLTPEQRTNVLRSARHIHAAAGQTLFVDGEPCSGMYIVMQGLVKLFKTSADGKEQVVRHMSAGDTFNEVPVFDGSPNPVSAAAVEPSNLIVLSRETMLAALREYPAVAEAVVQVFASRLRHLVALVEDLSFRQVTARVARIVLQSVSPHEGVGAGVGGRVRVTQREIAEMAGTSREVVARALKALEDAGAIDARRGEIQIVDDALLNTLS
ncbi:MAG TPA: Crp/Fnr family transcriptional regulator [Dehalococcoidia bacterium]|nr:Crp/Fnr family transcriptional regulator [Dehalococcoidia bacterium]